MPKILFNPTNEHLECQYVGELVKIPSLAKIRVDDARGRQVLNNLFPRGLTELEYGDEGEIEARKAEEGRQRNRDFKRRQVNNFNAEQDKRTQLKLGFLTPEPFLKAYAAELGMKLFEPYSSTDESKKEGMELRQEITVKDALIQAKDRELEELKAQMANLTKLVKQVISQQPTPEAPQPPAPQVAVVDDGKTELDEIRKSIRGINRTHFAGWVRKNYDSIADYPPDIQVEIRDKYTRMYALPFPETRAEAEATVQ